MALTPGTPYTLILNQLSGDLFLVLAASVSQEGDQAILVGQPQTNLNLTFGEGIFAVPEPSSSSCSASRRCAWQVMLAEGLWGGALELKQIL